MAIGFWFFQNYEWYYPFNLSIVLMTAGVLMTVSLFPEQELHPERKFPFFGAFCLLGVMITILLYIKYCDTDFDVFDFWTMLYFFVAADFAGAFVLHERWSDDPLIPRGFIKNRVQLCTIVCMLFVGMFAIGVMQSVIKLFVVYFHLDFYKASYQIFILICGGAITSLSSSFLLPKTGVRVWMFLGTVLSLFALLLVAEFGYMSASNLQICMFFLGLGFGCFVTQLMYGSQFFTKDRDMGTMSHTMLLSRFIGIVIGNALFADVISHVMMDDLINGNFPFPGDIEDLIELIYFLLFEVEDIFESLLSDGVHLAAMVAAIGIISVGITALFMKKDNEATKVRESWLPPKKFNKN